MLCDCPIIVSSLLTTVLAKTDTAQQCSDHSLGPPPSHQKWKRLNRCQNNTQRRTKAAHGAKLDCSAGLMSQGRKALSQKLRAICSPDRVMPLRRCRAPHPREKQSYFRCWIALIPINAPAAIKRLWIEHYPVSSKLSLKAQISFPQ